MCALVVCMSLQARTCGCSSSCWVVPGLGFKSGAGGGFYKLSADHSECKQASNIGNNTKSWHVGTVNELQAMRLPFPFSSCLSMACSNFAGGFPSASTNVDVCLCARVRVRIIVQCEDAGYIRPAGSFLGRQFYQKATPDDLKHYKIDPALDPHYSTAGGDRYIG